MKIYIVSARYTCELEEPLVFKNKEEAEKAAHDYVWDSITEQYCCEFGEEAEDAEESAIEEWAKENGDYYSTGNSYFYWDGGGDAYESRVSEFEIQEVPNET